MGDVEATKEMSQGVNQQPFGVSVVIVNYNTKDKLRQCLQALSNSNLEDVAGMEVIVVDNASSDNSPEMVGLEFPKVELVRNSKNVGFGSANNIGIRGALHELVLLLNSDAYVDSESIRTLVQVFDDPTVVAAGPKLLNPDGTLQESSCNRLTLWAVYCEQMYLEKIFPSSKLFSPYWNSRWHHETSETEQVMGACLMMRRGLELFDERFFLYCEDTELCKRLRRHGKILYVPESEVTHDLGSSSDSSRWRAIAFYNRGKELYFQIHHGKLQSFLCWWFNRSGAFLRAFMWTAAAVLSLNKVPSWGQKAALFWKVFSAPISGPPDPRSTQTLPRSAE